MRYFMEFFLSHTEDEKMTDKLKSRARQSSEDLDHPSVQICCIVVVVSKIYGQKYFLEKSKKIHYNTMFFRHIIIMVQ